MWEAVNYEIPDGILWAWIPDLGDKILAVSVDSVVIDIETGEEVYASHYIPIVEPTGEPIIH